MNPVRCLSDACHIAVPAQKASKQANKRNTGQCRARRGPERGAFRSPQTSSDQSPSRQAHPSPAPNSTMSPGSPWSRVLRRWLITSITTDSSSIADPNDGVPITAFSLPTNPLSRSVSIHLPSAFQRGNACLQKFEAIAANPRRQFSLGAPVDTVEALIPTQNGK